MWASPNVDGAIDAARLLRVRSFDLDFAGDEAVALVLRFRDVAGDHALLHHVSDRAVNLLLDGSNAQRHIDDVLRNPLASEFQREQIRQQTIYLHATRSSEAEVPAPAR